MRRRAKVLVDESQPPDWLVRFEPNMWEPGPAGEWLASASAETRARQDYIRRRRAWSAAGHRWLTEHGRPPGDWYALVHPDSVPLGLTRSAPATFYGVQVGSSGL